jgi:hypothetical protein
METLDKILCVIVFSIFAFGMIYGIDKIYEGCHQNQHMILENSND